jgi:hypothetical protein
VRVRPKAPIYFRTVVYSSISAREADGSGANPGFLTIYHQTL